jgi:hypothetical protein
MCVSPSSTQAGDHVGVDGKSFAITNASQRSSVSAMVCSVGSNASALIVRSDVVACIERGVTRRPTSIAWRTPLCFASRFSYMIGTFEVARPAFSPAAAGPNDAWRSAATRGVIPDILQSEWLLNEC